MRHHLYKELSDLRDKMERLLPVEREDEPQQIMGLEEGGYHEPLIEANPLGLWQLECTPTLWRAQEGFGARLTHECKRQHVCQVTRQLGLNDAEPRALDTEMPEGIRLWHATEHAQGLLFHARHDLAELFNDKRRQGLPWDDDFLGGAVTLLATPRRTLGFRDSMTLLRDRSPYLTRLCAEYARMACRLFGLDMREFAGLAQMRITRHPQLPTPIALLPSGGGFYDSGPALSVVIGRPEVARDFSPLLLPDKTEAVRVAVGEGVLAVLDGHIRVAYGHGYASLEPRESSKAIYTIDWALDCMRRTRLVEKIPPMGWLVMHTPTVSSSQNVVERRQAPKTGSNWPRDALISCPVRSLLQSIRSRLQARESFLLSQEPPSSLTRD